MQYHDAYNCGVALNDNWTVHLLVSIWSLGRRKHGLADKLKEATWDWIWRFHSKCFLGFERNANQRIQTSGIDSECFLRLETWTSKLKMKLKLKLFVKFERVCWYDPWYMMRKCEINAQESGIFWQFKIDFQKICNCFFPQEIGASGKLTGRRLSVRRLVRLLRFSLLFLVNPFYSDYSI